jgi:aminoglycoside phosphotransferase (APT) family kinase protein
MNEGEVHVDTDVVRRLLRDQFPQWAHLALTKIVSNGTDNAMFRLGDDLVVRLPRVHWAFADVEKEQRWLPYLAPHLPVAIPTPVGRGRPTDEYGHEWSILRWLRGELPGGQCDDRRLARDVAGFLNALHSIDPADGPRASRGLPLSSRVEYAMTGLAGIADIYDTGQLRAWPPGRCADWKPC